MTVSAIQEKSKPRGLDWALGQKTGSHTANHLLIRMGQVGNTSLLCFKSIDALSRDTQMSVSTVKRSLRLLLRERFIEKIRAPTMRRATIT